MSGRDKRPRGVSRVILAALAVWLAAVGVAAEEFGAPVVLRTMTPEIDRAFGASVAVYGDTLAVGVPDSPEGGVVYVYQRRAGLADGWQLKEVVSGVDPSNSEGFGWTMSLEGQTLVVGSPWEDSRDLAAGCGYVFYRDRGGASKWGRAKTLVPRDLEPWTSYGLAVAKSGDLIAVGALGMETVYVHERDLPIRSWWGVQERVDNPNTGPRIDYTYGFGRRVGLSGKTLAVGGYRHRESNADPTDVTIYDLVEDEEGEPIWTQVDAMSGRESWDRSWARRMSLWGDLLLTGGGTAPSYAARVFQRNWPGRNRWGMRAHLRDPGVNLHEVHDVAMRGRTAAVAADFRALDLAGSFSGVLVFERHVPTNHKWRPIARLIAADVEGNAESVAIGSREIVVGYPDSGSVVVFPRAPLVAVDFEAGDTTGLSWTTGNVAVVSPGLRETDFALEVMVDGTARRSMVRARHPHRDPVVSLSFQLAANRVALGGQRVEIMNLYGPTRDLVRLTLEEDPNVDQYWLRLWAWEEAGKGWREAGKARLPPLRGVRVEIDWRAATGPGHDNGRVRLLVGGKLKVHVEALDTDLQFVNGLLLGLPEGSRGTAGGTFLMDEIVLHR